MKTIDTLFENKWVSLKEVKDKDQKINGYVYSHETRCNGHIVSILPFRHEYNGKQWLLRKELTPCWSMEERILSSITGGLEGTDPDYTIVEELKEEAGYFIDKKDLIQLGTCFGTKSSDTIYHLYSVDLTGYVQGTPTTTDPGEQMSHCVWSKDIKEAQDPFVYVSYLRLQSI